MIQIERLSYKNIIKSIDLTILKGLTIVLGRNGSGKTTLFDCIAGVNSSYQGSIEGNRSIVYLSQSVYFSNRLTVKHFVKFVARLSGVSGYWNAFNKFVLDNNLRFYFDNNWNVPMGRLSGGQQRIVIMAPLLFLDREWYLLDEPFASVDDIGKECIIEIINKLILMGKGIIFSNHDSGIKSHFDEFNEVYIDRGTVVQ